jgi:rhodanese-related sulfurtransferase
MLNKLIVPALTLALSVPVVAWACDDEKDTMAMITLEEAQTSAKQISFVDANSKETRSKYGVIPGAVLLTSFDAYDTSKELPSSKDKKLVFYCANSKCGASKVAAKRAQAAGYTNVAVLPDGISGWKEKGAPVETPRS